MKIEKGTMFHVTDKHADKMHYVPIIGTLVSYSRYDNNKYHIVHEKDTGLWSVHLEDLVPVDIDNQRAVVYLHKEESF